MNEEELRKKIYEILGLEFGSLSNEGGNDWIRAKNQAIEEYKQIEFEKLKNVKSTDYLKIDKNSEEFNMALNSKFIETSNFKILIAQRNDLTNEEIDKLIVFGNKDILINLAKYQKLTSDQIDKIIPNSVFLTKKNIIENQELNSNQKEKILDLMAKSSLDYKELINKLNEA
ncbi:hypothetical protein CP985_04175 [Malaciobacter mytili LMG 24559]|uniref:Uncharacterized protein n=1 Tax=Malaciobacter mytili LMG 24559 TaxID=1032238 RepID=A0AAX2AIH3_9BACT|nr:hypothetical protein [Malaciobacter mytili]AXH13751.1 hypothetical protein AMYT_0126 [Malaciobacter mytili LMG 24559]RXK16360.1 hypothetical protein CP985_04175 [Malaciobacter mytili LMG 24559]